MSRAAQAIQRWHGARIVLLWVAAALAGLLLLAWQDALAKRDREITDALLGFSPDNPYLALSALRKYVAADTVLWIDSGPKVLTPARETLNARKRQVWDRLSRSVQRDVALATGISFTVLGILPVGMLTLTWVWFGGSLRRNEHQSRKRIREWHFGKLVLLWFGAFLLLYVLVEAFPFRERTTALILWAALAFPVAVITWKWLGGRERHGPPPREKET